MFFCSQSRIAWPRGIFAAGWSASDIESSMRASGCSSTSSLARETLSSKRSQSLAGMKWLWTLQMEFSP